MRLLFVFTWSLIGLIVGSFLNVAVRRLPKKEKLIAPTHCSNCGKPQPIYALSALLVSVLGSGGSCARCGAGIDRSSLTVELVSAVAFGLLAAKYGPTIYTLLSSIYTSILIIVSFIDLRHRLILNRVTYPAFLVALALTPILTPSDYTHTLLGAAAGGTIFGLVYAAGYLIYRKAAIALGDVKLAILLGAMFGFPRIFVVLLLGTLFGAIASIVVMVTRRGTRHDFMPYGPALCLGGFISFLVDIVGT